MDMSKPRYKYEVWQGGNQISRHTNINSALLKALRHSATLDKRNADDLGDADQAFVWDIGHRKCIAAVRSK
jgi:hypothetical protein